LTRAISDWVWDGGDNNDNNWSSRNNWVGNPIFNATAGDTIVFGRTPVGAGDLTPNNDTMNLTLAEILFEGNQAFTLSGNPLTLTGNAMMAGIVNNSTVAQTINIPIILGANQTFDAAMGSLVFGGVIQGGGMIQGPYTLTLNGPSSSSITFNAVVGGGNDPLASLIANVPWPARWG
jgi:hypothetical protein